MAKDTHLLQMFTAYSFLFCFLPMCLVDWPLEFFDQMVTFADFMQEGRGDVNIRGAYDGDEPLMDEVSGGWPKELRPWRLL